MVRNKEKYRQVISLRKRGFTLEEIAKYCGVSKSTASRWLKNHGFSKQISEINYSRARRENAKRLKLIIKTRHKERSQRYKDVQNFAATEFRHYSKNPKFMIGLSVYVSTGNQGDDKVIRLSHKNPVIHRLFINFCQEFLGIDKSKIHFWLILYKKTEELKIRKKWSKITTIPCSRFYKTQFINNKKEGKNLHLGVGNTIISDVYCRHRLRVWSNLFQQSVFV